MIKELQRRPMVRLLLVWITGILLQTVFSIGAYSLFFLLIPILLVLFSFIVRKESKAFNFSGRLNWGICFAFLLLFLSVQFTIFRENKLENESFNSSSVPEAIIELRDRYLLAIDQLDITEEEKAVLATVSLGYRRNLPREVRNQFSLTGTAHILAVSGMHVAILCGFFTFLLSYLPFKERFPFLIYILRIVFVWSYIGMTGCAASAMRAGWMISFYLTGKFLVKNTDTWNSMAATAFLMLVVDPFYLFNVGFQLSFMAVFFILYIDPFFRHFFPVKNPLLAVPMGWFSIACAAQLGVTLLLIYYFGYVSLLFLFTSLPISLLITCLLPVSFIWLLVPEWFPGYFLLKRGVEWGIHSLCVLVERFAGIEGYTFYFSFSRWEVLIGYVLLIVLIEYFRRKNRIFLHKKSYL